MTANIVAQALVQSKDDRPKNHVGPRPVEQKALPDREPYNGDRKKFQPWWTLLLSVLGKADKSWHAVLKRLHEFPATAIKAEDLRTIVGSDDQPVIDAYQDELFRVMEQRTSGDPRAVLIKLGVAR